jgi:hypothetical protein
MLETCTISSPLHGRKLRKRSCFRRGVRSRIDGSQTGITGFVAWVGSEPPPPLSPVPAPKLMTAREMSLSEQAGGLVFFCSSHSWSGKPAAKPIITFSGGGSCCASWHNNQRKLHQPRRTFPGSSMLVERTKHRSAPSSKTRSCA